jgi:tRNA threonylcarbamoyladenosine biosynthesis protein TsaE
VRTVLPRAEDTVAFGTAYASRLVRGDVVLLFGPLGAGKTTMVSGLAAGLGVTESVVSPTYTLLEVYEGRWPVHHFDFYRLADPQELRTIDPREYYDLGVTIMEWPERIEALWPRRRHEMRLGFDPAGRWVDVTPPSTP